MVPTLNALLTGEINNQVAADLIDKFSSPAFQKLLADEREGLFLRGMRAIEGLGDWQTCASQYRNYLNAEPQSADVHFRLGYVLEKIGRYDEAETEYQKAIELRPDATYWKLRMAETQGKAGRIEDSCATSEDAIKADPTAPDYLCDLLKFDHRWVVTRTRVGRFMEANWEAVLAEAERIAARPKVDLDPLPIFVYWAQGESNAPPVVRMCISRMRRMLKHCQLHVLDDTTVPFYADVPSHLLNNEGITRTHFSDILRLHLLAKYGGIWLDATCFLTEEFESSAMSLSKQDFFCFSYNGPRIASWFMCADKSSWLVTLTLAALHVYWKRHRKLTGYFMLHDMIEILYCKDERFRQSWDQFEHVYAMPGRMFEKQKLKQFDPEAYAAIYEGFILHKLTYKYQPESLKAGSMIAHIMRTNPL